MKGIRNNFQEETNKSYRDKAISTREKEKVGRGE
jgi:hypothetical protein